MKKPYRRMTYTDRLIIMHRKILGYATAAELFEAWQETLVQKNLTKVFERT